MAKTVEKGDVGGFEPLSGADDPIHLCDVYGSEIRSGHAAAARPARSRRSSRPTRRDLPSTVGRRR